MILFIDNYDSFTYNLVQYFQTLGEDVRVYRNDSISIEEIRAMKPEIVVISPGPCSPKEAGLSLEVVNSLKGEIPILGICLGHQTIGEAFGGEIVKAKVPVHGKVHPIRHRDVGVFQGLKNPLNVTRYHSLVIDRDSLPACLEITAETRDNEIMGIRHKEYDIEGVQFHPEAILTEMGMELLNNFLLHIRSKNNQK